MFANITDDRKANNAAKRRAVEWDNMTVKLPLTPEAAEEFAHGWIAAWNARDIAAVMEYYADKVHFRSPTAHNLLQDGRIDGAYELKRYFAKALSLVEALHFDLLGVFTGHDSVTILYRNQNAMEAAETFLFNHDGKVMASTACYRLDGTASS